MKSLIFVSGIAMLTLVGCANKHALTRSMEQTEGTRAVATEVKADSATVQSANAHLDSAKAYMEQKKNQEAMNALETSRLEYRLAMLRAERDSLKTEDERVEGELRADVERKLLYQNILENENKEAK